MRRGGCGRHEEVDSLRKSIAAASRATRTGGAAASRTTRQNGRIGTLQIGLRFPAERIAAVLLHARGKNERFAFPHVRDANARAVSVFVSGFTLRRRRRVRIRLSPPKRNWYRTKRIWVQRDLHHHSDGAHQPAYP